MKCLRDSKGPKKDEETASGSACFTVGIAEVIMGIDEMPRSGMKPIERIRTSRARQPEVNETNNTTLRDEGAVQSKEKKGDKKIQKKTQKKT